MTAFSDTIDTLLGPDGVIARHSGFAFREQQHTMAQAIAHALETEQHLVVEAPTGVGKTLAYLLPAVIHALENNRTAVISTHTKNLQDQLLQKDIPLARALLGKDFRALAMKGRRNYLCVTRLENAIAYAGSLFTDDVSDELLRLKEWSGMSTDGDVGTCPFVPRPEVWDAVCSEPGVCTPRACGSRCFYQQLRERARRSAIVVMNHALFFSLLPLRQTEDQFLFDNDFVILDEAHLIEQAAGNAFGERVSRRGLLSAVHRLYHRKGRKGLLAPAPRGLASGIRGVEECIEDFFAEYAGAAKRLRGGAHRDGARPEQEIRVTVPDIVPDTLSGPLQELLHKVGIAEEQVDDVARKQEIAAVRQSLERSLTVLQGIMGLNNPRAAYWIEVGKAPNDNIVLSAAPYEVNELLAPRLFADRGPTILTSATLSVDGSLDYIKERLGAGQAGDLILDTPFDFARQMRVWLARFMPEPDSPDYQRALPDAIMHCIRATHGKALVLFTSSGVMHATARALGEKLEDAGIRMLVQGADMQRHALLEEFKRDVHSVLLGLDSFWMGVDVPGEALEHVIITRLPFAVPSHPLMEARLEDLQRRGVNPFRAFSLPEAILKFRQGAGRLIRTVTDTGIVSILDSRIFTKPYGRMFLGALPRCRIEILTRDGDVEPLDAFFV